MKLTRLLISLIIAQTAFAQFPPINETFENEISDAFQKSIQIDEARTKIENVKIHKNKSSSLVIDFADKTVGYPLMLRLPAGNSALNTGKNTYSISFDYKILALPSKADACVAAIQRRKGSWVFSDDVKFFGKRVGETGKIQLHSLPPSNGVNSAFFILSSKSTGAKIAIDNFKIEKGLTYPEWTFEKDVLWGIKVSPLNYNFFSQNPQLSKITKEQFFPFIDKFGQFKHKRWKNKIYSIEDLKKRAKEEEHYLANTPDIPKRDKYFGYINPDYKFKATGRFRTEKVNGKWFFVTPEGNLFWSFGVNTIGLFAPTPITNREHYFDDISDKSCISNSNQTRLLFKAPHQVFLFERRTLSWKYGANWEKTYGNIADSRARKWGVNTFGCWTQHYIIKNSEIPYTHSTSAAVACNIKSKYHLNTYWRPAPDYFSPDFRPRTIARFMTERDIMNNPRCIGVFVDNELPWQPKIYALGYAIVQSPADQPAKLKFLEILVKKYQTIAALNKAWSAKYKNWENFLKSENFIPKTETAKEDILKIEDLYYREYFSVCRDALKMASPETLYLGCRFAWSNPNVCKIASEYVDVVSYNWYRDDTKELTNPQGALDKPIIVSEYHFGNQDAGVFGGGLRPKRTMKERIQANNNYIATALKNPNIVGAHWFRWADQITSGRDNDGENYSCGMVDICDTPQYDFVKSIRKISEKMYDIRLQK